MTGLDCQFTGARGNLTRVVGTAISRGAITGGHVVQASTFARVVGQSGSGGRRQRWPNYLAQPGLLVASRRIDLADLSERLMDEVSNDDINLGAVSSRLLDAVQRAGLDRHPPVRFARTQLRWTAVIGRPRQIHFSEESATLRTIRLRTPDDDLESVAEFCEDVAVHDWLLSCVVQILERTRFSANSPQQVAQRLRPVFDHILHLWMPAARQRGPFAALWTSLDRGASLTRQWEASSSRIRDQVATRMPYVFDGDEFGALL